MATGEAYKPQCHISDDGRRDDGYDDDGDDDDDDYDEVTLVDICWL